MINWTFCLSVKSQDNLPAIKSPSPSETFTPRAVTPLANYEVTICSLQRRL